MDTRERSWYTYGKKYEELTLESDFLFCKIMQDTELCREMLQRIIQCVVKPLALAMGI